MHPSQDGTQKKNSGERIRDCLHYFVFELICETGEKTRNVTNRKKYKRLLAEKETKTLVRNRIFISSSSSVPEEHHLSDL